MLTTSVNTSDTTIASVTVALDKFQALLDKEIIALVRMKDAGANLKIRLQLSSPITILSEYQGAASDATTQILNKTTPLIFYGHKIYDKLTIPSATNVVIYIVAYRTVAGAANVAVDFFMLLPRPYLTFIPINSGWTLTSTTKNVVGYNYSTNAFDNLPDITGDAIELVPEHFNLLFFAQGSSASFPITLTETFGRVSIWPRYALV